jgi:hypothetical protein
VLDLLDALAALRAHDQPPPRPPRLPSAAELDAIESEIGAAIPGDLRLYLMQASDVTVGTLEPITITDASAHTHLPGVLADARGMGVPPHWFPFCMDNGDFFCMDAEGRVHFWSHDGAAAEEWPSLADWIRSCWLGELD